MFHTLHAFGFVYYEVYNSMPAMAGGLPVGWISRVSIDEPYVCFFCDGKRKASATRGSQKNARAWIEEQAAAQ